MTCKLHPGYDADNCPECARPMDELIRDKRRQSVEAFYEEETECEETI